MLANVAGIRRLPPINPASSSPIHQRNPCRAIPRWKHPEPFIALLAFIPGIWLWDHDFVKSAGCALGTEQVALIKIDRALRLAQAMDDASTLLRRLTGAKKSEAAVRQFGRPAGCKPSFALRFIDIKS